MPLAELLPPDGERIAAAIAVAAGYAGFCGNVVRSHLRRRSAATAAAPAADGAVLVVHASQTGFAEAIARQTAEMLERAEVAVRLLPASALDQALLASASRALFVVS